MTFIQSLFLNDLEDQLLLLGRTFPFLLQHRVAEAVVSLEVTEMRVRMGTIGTCMAVWMMAIAVLWWFAGMTVSIDWNVSLLLQLSI